ncbi:HAMP domain-containing protein [Aliigemmobacter aestuarii]|uniref:histidine kinase n=1 Tax=Aliigemmobacter aestuarii TaxID=1445661 RepID=A0A4S3MRN8_9RHOB|nr:ATP-binding protein [Gemmobacter aestuarii]THD84743.1 HAMP domain-containing protein [Gemmobacter aestuarii]
MFNPKTILPRGLYGRAALILLVPIVTIQLVVSIAFIQRHFERVTRQMTQGVAVELRLLLDDLARDPVAAAQTAKALGMTVNPVGDGSDAGGAAGAEADRRDLWDLSGRQVILTLRAELDAVEGVDLQTDPDAVLVLLRGPGGDVTVRIDRRRVSASNPHQLLVLMIFTSVLMTFIAYRFLRNQLRPITRLAKAAEAFGKGEHLPYRPSGAVEVRAAGNAFLEMRARIERQIEQRTMMLSGVSHDLRTPLTRLRLGLSMLPEDEDTRALLADVADMERLVDEFLSFARGDAIEEPEATDPLALVQRVVENAGRAGQAVSLVRTEGAGTMRLRPAAVTRAVENLIGNAVRHGKRAEVSVLLGERSCRITIEDDGPGIPEDRRDEAMQPFARLDQARDPNRGGGVGLGLSIAADIARSHGGSLRIGQSETLGGARIDLILAR